MKQNRSLIILAGILVVLIGLYFVVDSGVLEPKKEKPVTPPPAENLTVTYYSGPAQDIEITDKNTTLTFTDSKTVWKSKEYEKYPMSETTLDNIAAVLCRLTASRALEYSESNVKLFGLDNPSMTVKFSNSSGVRDTLLIGNRNSATGDYYITIEGSKKLFMMSASYADMLSTDIMKFVLIPEFVDFTPDSVKFIEYCHEGKSYSIDKVDTSKSDHINLLNYINATYLSACQDPYTEDLEKYGLANSDTYIKVIYTESGSNQEKEFLLTVGNIHPDDDRYFYVVLNDYPNTVYRIFNLNLTRVWDAFGI